MRARWLFPRRTMPRRPAFRCPKYEPFSLWAHLLSVAEPVTARSAWPQTLYGHTAAVLALDIDVDFGLVVSGSADKTVLLWDVARERCSHVLYGHTGPWS